MNYETIRKMVIGDPAGGKAGLQDDWWTGIAPDIAASHGSYLKDTDGNEYLDCCGFFSTAPIRFDHKRLRDEETVAAFGRVAVYRPSISDFWTEEMAAFIEAFRRIATPDYFQHYFFIDGGGLAIENALKAAFDWKVRLNVAKGKITTPEETLREEKRPLGTKVVYFQGAFHGRTGYTLSMTNTADSRKYKYFPKFDWIRLVPPFMTFDADGHVVDEPAVTTKVNAAVAELEQVLTAQSDDIAAIIIEPIQCEGGDRHIPTEFFVALRRLADAHDVILIYDEVQTGVGATGKMWAHEYFGPDARPDMIAFAKKAQVAGVMANYERLGRVPQNVFRNKDLESMSRLNSTWGGHPVDMMRSQLILEIIEEENLLENATKVGAHFLAGLRQLARDFSGIVSNARGRGMMVAFDTPSSEKQAALFKAAWKGQKLLLMTCGKTALRFRPHLDMTVAEADDAIARLRRACESIQ